MEAEMQRKVTFLLSYLCCLCMLVGCDTIFRKQFIIDFENNTAGSFTVARPGDLDNLFSRIEGIADGNGLKCRPYNAARKYHVCTSDSVKLATYFTDEKAVTIELTQFGPWSKTEQYLALEKDLSKFVKEEFPGQNVEIKR
jgi:hypothetical protein